MGFYKGQSATGGVQKNITYMYVSTYNNRIKTDTI